MTCCASLMTLLGQTPCGKCLDYNQTHSWALNESSSGLGDCGADCKRRTNKKESNSGKKKKEDTPGSCMSQTHFLASVFWTTVNACWMKSETRRGWRKPEVLTVLSDKKKSCLLQCWTWCCSLTIKYRMTSKQVLMFWLNSVACVFTYQTLLVYKYGCSLIF